MAIMPAPSKRISSMSVASKSASLQHGPKKSKVSSGVVVDDGKDGTFFQVEKVVGRRTRRGVVQYLIRWQGCDDSEDTWEPTNNLCDSAMEEAYKYEQEKKKLAAAAASSKTTVVNKKKKIVKKMAAKAVGRIPKIAMMSTKGTVTTTAVVDKNEVEETSPSPEFQSLFDKISDTLDAAEGAIKQEVGAESAEAGTMDEGDENLLSSKEDD